MFEVLTILDDDSAELVSGGANGLGASLSIEIEEEEDAPDDSGGGRVAAEIGLDAALGFLNYSSNIG
ncbi:hypothetical protein Tco_1110995 [Tanacetum coccineum]|uniref:Uncharacterized protein n=1 Tax=Tanacetum coccineum TaxID=301880 RepID=A0ABQ5IKG1_9ASTR